MTYTFCTVLLNTEDVALARARHIKISTVARKLFSEYISRSNKPDEAASLELELKELQIQQAVVDTQITAKTAVLEAAIVKEKAEELARAEDARKKSFVRMCAYCKKEILEGEDFIKPFGGLFRDKFLCGRNGQACSKFAD